MILEEIWGYILFIFYFFFTNNDFQFPDLKNIEAVCLVSMFEWLNSEVQEFAEFIHSF